MGYIIKLILFFIVVNFMIKLLFRFFLGWKMKNANSNSYTQRQREQRQREQQRSQKNTPGTQEERILDFQRKNFEKTDAEDAEFIEIK